MYLLGPSINTRDFNLFPVSFQTHHLFSSTAKSTSKKIPSFPAFQTSTVPTKPTSQILTVTLTMNSTDVLLAAVAAAAVAAEGVHLVNLHRRYRDQKQWDETPEFKGIKSTEIFPGATGKRANFMDRRSKFVNRKEGGNLLLTNSRINPLSFPTLEKTIHSPTRLN